MVTKTMRGSANSRKSVVFPSRASLTAKIRYYPFAYDIQIALKGIAVNMFVLRFETLAKCIG